MKNLRLSSLIKNILKEDPDEVILSVDVFNDPLYTVGYDEGNSYTFVVGEKYSFVGPTVNDNGDSITHDDVIGLTKDVIQLINRGEKLSNVDDYFKWRQINVWNIEDFYNDVKKSGPDASALDNNHDSRDIPRFVTGRFWSDKKIISFWNEKSRVIKLWSSIEKMIRHEKISIFDQYRVDWVERSELFYDGEFEPIGTVKSFRNKKNVPVKDIEPEKLKNILKKLHLASPQEKRELLNKIGANVPSKAAKIADKLNMTVAQFNALMNINENI
jgi:hypothetical protein